MSRARAVARRVPAAAPAAAPPVRKAPHVVPQMKLAVSTPGDTYEQEADQVAESVMRMTDSAPPQILQRACAGGCSDDDDRVQMKLAVSTPGDAYEQEADHVAEQVMRMVDPAPPEISDLRSAPPVQRACAGGCSDDDDVVQRKCDGCRERDEQLQRKSSSDATHVDTSSIERDLPRGGGQPLGRELRSFFEPRFGRDFSDVRVHTGAGAAESARSVRALAYTVGRDIVFAPGAYSPHTSSGRNLLAHELTHTIQQRGGAIQPRLMRQWDAATADCGTPTKTSKWVKTVDVNQEQPQTVTLHWSDGTSESDIVSTGKGHCCVEPGSGAATCDAATSRVTDTNCTPVTTGTGLPIINRVRDHGGVEFWSEIDHGRAIALHEYSPVDGTPLSHGCVRMNHDIAVKLFCGARQNVTRVLITGLARPNCEHQALQDEWANDLFLSSRVPDGEPADTQRAIREEHREVALAFGDTSASLDARLARLSADTGDFLGAPNPGPITAPATTAQRDATLATVAAEIPRCTADTLQSQIIGTTSFGSLITPFRNGLNATRTIARANDVVDLSGISLWNAATNRARRAGGSTDDRPLYWTREQMVGVLRQWQPTFTLAPADRTALIDRFERTSRGMTSVSFGRTAGVKKILISGFDPFNLRLPSGDPRNGNPSGAAAIALDGERVSNGSITGIVQSVVFPVRYREFDAGWVETFFTPFLSGTSRVDMIMTISQGGAQFDVEEFASRSRGVHSDNAGVLSPGAPRSTGAFILPSGQMTQPTLPPGMPAGAEFTRSTLPRAAIRTSLGRTGADPSETEAFESAPGTIDAREFHAGASGAAGLPTSGQISIAGSGGDFLSNEIMYRTTLLRDTTGSTVPVGHLHTPFLPPPTGAGITDAAFEAARDSIVTSIRRILNDVLPSL